MEEIKKIEKIISSHTFVLEYQAKLAAKEITLLLLEEKVELINEILSPRSKNDGESIEMTGYRKISEINKEIDSLKKL